MQGIGVKSLHRRGNYYEYYSCWYYRGWCDHMSSIWWPVRLVLMRIKQLNAAKPFTKLILRDILFDSTIHIIYTIRNDLYATCNGKIHDPLPMLYWVNFSRDISNGNWISWIFKHRSWSLWVVFLFVDTFLICVWFRLHIGLVRLCGNVRKSQFVQFSIWTDVKSFSVYMKNGIFLKLFWNQFLPISD